MSHHQVRLFFCVLLVGLALVIPRQGPVMASAAPALPKEQPYTIAIITVPNAPQMVIPTAEGVFYRHGISARSEATPPYVDPAFQQEMRWLRRTLLDSAERHNRPTVTGMTTEEFAVVMAAQLYFEHNAVLENRAGVTRAMTPLYQGAQEIANRMGVGNFTVWPSNLRPSVGLSLLRGEMPYIDGDDQPAVLTLPITIAHSPLKMAMVQHPTWEPALSAVAIEIVQPRLAVEYLAANFEIASYRAEYDWTPVTWMTLAAWHNQGVVNPAAMAGHSQLATVLPGVQRYLPAAMTLIYVPEAAPFNDQPVAQ